MPALAAQLAALREHAAASSCSPERTIAALRGMAARLADPADALSAALRRELHAATGLTLPMIEWGLSTSLASLQRAELEALVQPLPAAPNRELIGVVLAGNVFVAALRALCLPLLAGAHVIAKAASREDAFPRAIARALADADAEVGARLAVLQFSREDAASTRALCQAVDALSIYGDDDAVRALGALTRPGSRVLAHGHGISAAYVSASQLTAADDAGRAAAALALDVAAYDQHGCLSPQFVWVEAGSAVTPHAFAELLAREALPAVQRLLPAAEPTLAERAARLQWQASAAVRGEVYATPEHVVSYEAELPPRPSPGGRLIAVHSCAGAPALHAALAPFADHLKLVGVAATREERAQLREQLRAHGTADACQLGEMQTPAFDALADGCAALAGLTPES